MWYHRPYPLEERLRDLFRWLFRTVAGAVVTTVAAAATLALIAYLGWSQVPEETKQRVEVGVTVLTDTEELQKTLTDLTEAIEAAKQFYQKELAQ